jgi:glycosylphosphatidylinositol transamidase (GPIT) subunit GPI8
MKTLLTQIIGAIVIIGLLILSVQQCSQKKSAQKETVSAVIDKQNAERDYMELIKAKTRIDTLYKKGETRFVPHDVFKTIRDTIYPDSPKVYGVYKDSINTAELKLQATITASDLKAIDYTYEVTKQIIREQSILTEHDTLVQTVRKGMLLGIADIGLHSYSAGLQYQSRKRLGFTARYNWFLSDGWVSVGVAYRIF